MHVSASYALWNEQYPFELPVLHAIRELFNSSDFDHGYQLLDWIRLRSSLLCTDQCAEDAQSRTSVGSLLPNLSSVLDWRRLDQSINNLLRE